MLAGSCEDTWGGGPGLRDPCGRSSVQPLAAPLGHPWSGHRCPGPWEGHTAVWGSRPAAHACSCPALAQSAGSCLQGVCPHPSPWSCLQGACPHPSPDGTHGPWGPRQSGSVRRSEASALFWRCLSPLEAPPEGPPSAPVSSVSLGPSQSPAWSSRRPWAPEGAHAAHTLLPHCNHADPRGEPCPVLRGVPWAGPLVGGGGRVHMGESPGAGRCPL